MKEAKKECQVGRKGRRRLGDKRKVWHMGSLSNQSTRGKQVGDSRESLASSAWEKQRLLFSFSAPERNVQKYLNLKKKLFIEKYHLFKCM